MSKLRLVLADDHPTLLEGLAATLESDYEIVGTYRDGGALVEAVKNLRPDIVILDISMPVLSGLAAAGHITEGSPETKLLFFTMHAGAGYVQAARKAGAKGLVRKSETPETLRNALAAIATGSECWPSGLGSADASVVPDKTEDSVIPQLSPREHDVLQMIAQGRSAKQIAYELHISIWTVTFHRQQIKKKLGISNTAELTRFAIEQGMG